MISRRPLSIAPDPQLPKHFLAACAAGRHRPFVVAVHGNSKEKKSVVCPSCGSTARLVPGAYYSDSYLGTLERAIEVLDKAAPAPREAEATSERLEELFCEPTRDRVLAVLRDLLRSDQLLQELREAQPHDDAQSVRKFIGLVNSLLRAYARRPLGVAAADDSAPRDTECTL